MTASSIDIITTITTIIITIIVIIIIIIIIVTRSPPAPLGETWDQIQFKQNTIPLKYVLYYMLYNTNNDDSNTNDHIQYITISYVI